MRKYRKITPGYVFQRFNVVTFDNKDRRVYFKLNVIFKIFRVYSVFSFFSSRFHAIQNATIKPVVP